MEYSLKNKTVHYINNKVMVLCADMPYSTKQ